MIISTTNSNWLYVTQQKSIRELVCEQVIAWLQLLSVNYCNVPSSKSGRDHCKWHSFLYPLWLVTDNVVVILALPWSLLHNSRPLTQDVNFVVTPLLIRTYLVTLSYSVHLPVSGSWVGKDSALLHAHRGFCTYILFSNWYMYHSILKGPLHIVCLRADVH